LNFDELVAFAERYGGDLSPGSDVSVREALLDTPIFSEPPEDRDDWAQVDAHSRRELAERFAQSFYFGCEADDRTVALASSKRNGLGVDLNATLGSDIGHWDVAHADHVVPLSRGGDHSPENVVICCAKCNLHKGAKYK
jgi:hypothetical protein